MEHVNLGSTGMEILYLQKFLEEEMFKNNIILNGIYDNSLQVKLLNYLQRPNSISDYEMKYLLSSSESIKDFISLFTLKQSPNTLLYKFNSENIINRINIFKKMYEYLPVLKNILNNNGWKIIYYKNQPSIEKFEFKIEKDYETRLPHELLYMINLFKCADYKKGVSIDINTGKLIKNSNNAVFIIDNPTNKNFIKNIYLLFNLDFNNLKNDNISKNSKITVGISPNTRTEILRGKTNIEIYKIKDIDGENGSYKVDNFNYYNNETIIMSFEDNLSDNFSTEYLKNFVKYGRIYMSLDKDINMNMFKTNTNDFALHKDFFTYLIRGSVTQYSGSIDINQVHKLYCKYNAMYNVKNSDVYDDSLRDSIRNFQIQCNDLKQSSGNHLIEFPLGFLNPQTEFLLNRAIEDSTEIAEDNNVMKRLT